jgi:apolipoprotein D and lipocalin family protein
MSNGLPTVPAVRAVDLPRFMGAWYVIASIPSYPERNACDAVESYELRSDGRIQTTFRYRKGSFDAPLKTMHPVGSVVPGTGNAVWGMQFIWPIKAEYVISYLDPGYSETIIARSRRDYAWIMARTPQIPEAAYAADVERLRAMGYDVSKLRKVPQSPR